MSTEISCLVLLKRKLLKKLEKVAGDYITRVELKNYAKQNPPPKIIPEEFANFKDFVK